MKNYEPVRKITLEVESIISKEPGKGSSSFHDFERLLTKNDC